MLPLEDAANATFKLNGESAGVCELQVTHAVGAMLIFRRSRIVLP